MNPHWLREQASALRVTADALERAASSAEGGGTLRLLGGLRLANVSKTVWSVGEELHYREVLERLEARGVWPLGRIACQTLLSALIRCEDFESVRRRSGLWRRIR